MMLPQEVLAELQAVCPRASLKAEGGQEFIDLPDLKIRSGGAILVRDGLLSLQQHSGYTSRLFVAQPIPNRGANWTTHNVMGRTWHTPSWNHVPTGRPVEMLLQHLKVYQ